MITQSKRDRLLRRKSRENSKIFKENLCDANADQLVVCFNKSGRHLYGTIKPKYDQSSILKAVSTLSFRERDVASNSDNNKENTASNSDNNKEVPKGKFIYKNHSNQTSAVRLGAEFAKVLHENKILDKILIEKKKKSSDEQNNNDYTMKNLVFHLGGHRYCGVVKAFVDSFRASILQLKGFQI